jgi:hypothetical protein
MVGMQQIWEGVVLVRRIGEGIGAPNFGDG